MTNIATSEFEDMYFSDDHAPPERKTVWLSCLYLGIPMGYALGYAFGGILSGLWSWRGAFVVDALVMVPFAIFCLTCKPIDLRKRDWELGR